VFKFFRPKKENHTKKAKCTKRRKDIEKNKGVLYDGRTKNKGGVCMKFQRLKDMVCGAAVASMVLCSGTVAFAKVANTSIPVSFSNIKIIVDGKQLSTSKEPFTYNGTTYLPVRAVAEAVGKDVTWDGTTKTVYLGEKPADTSASKTKDGKNNDIEITGATLDYEYGLPKLYLDFKNNTNYDIDRFDIYINCFDAYGESVDSIPYNYYYIKKLEKKSENSEYWQLYSNGTSIVQFGIYKYKTSDGRTVEIPKNEIEWLQTKYEG
jgi:hypothetical protein